MRHVGLAIVATAALMLTETAASAASKHYPRHARQARAPAVHHVPSPSFGPARVMQARPYGCVQDEGYGRWTLCGQGPP
jgi:hypothetical protein